MSAAADYVIIGAGSAGCAMAYRLAEAGKKVLVIEHGGTDAGPFIQMPAALSYPMNMAMYDWGFHTEPEPHLGGRQLATPRGKVIGGSSSVNGMIYVRGHARDYDHWAESGAAGWAYADVLPYFKRMEHWHSGGHGGDKNWRGKNGPLHVTRGPRTNPLTRAFVEAGRQAGYPVTGDYNGQQQEGFGPFDATIWKGRRWSAANAYLRPAMKTGNCTVIRAFARRVVIEDGRATGVEVARGGKIEVIEAGREVIVAASSINSPKILMLSGIGPAAHLKEHGIEVLALCPGPVHTGFGEVARRGENAKGMPSRELFYVAKERVVAEAFEALEKRRARVFPGLRTTLAAQVFSLMPMGLMRLCMSRRPRRS